VASPDDAVRAHKHLRRYVLNSENVTVATRLHLAKLLEPAATTVAVAVLCAWIHQATDVGGVWVLWLPAVLRLVVRWAEWNYEWFVATDKRLILTYGFVIHKVAMMPLAKVTDMGYTRTPVGQVLGYGRFVMESAGQDQALRQVDYMPDPDQTYRTLVGTIFRPGTPPAKERPAPPPAIVPQGPREPRPTTAELPVVSTDGGGSDSRGGDGAGADQGRGTAWSPTGAAPRDDGERDRRERRRHTHPDTGGVTIPQPFDTAQDPRSGRRRRRPEPGPRPPSSDGAGTTVPDPFL